MTSRYIPQLSFSFYRHRAIRADFSGGQITSDAGLLPLRAFDPRHGLNRSSFLLTLTAWGLRAGVQAGFQMPGPIP